MRSKKAPVPSYQMDSDIDSNQEEDEEILSDGPSEPDYKGQQERLLMALQQQAVAAAANLSFLGPNSTGSWTPNLTAMTNHGNGSSLVISSSSPGGGSSSSGPTSGSSTGPSSNNRQEHLEAGKGYTFEEQFKQLYELSDDPKRKEFLDDLFSFMQKKGQPVNRIPIMAKQVLDLYELYRLVVARGGLVEVINKKIWREITKGLNLPSSITSAAFTLRTQYMKYLYQYECEKEHLSSQDELQQAIDGNRREGRRSSYGHYSEMVGATPPPPGLTPRSNSNNNHISSSHHTSPLSLVSRQIVNGNNSQGPSSGEEDNDGRSTSSTPSHVHINSGGNHHVSASNRIVDHQHEALNLEVKSGSATGHNNHNSSNNNGSNNNNNNSVASINRELIETAREMAARKLLLSSELAPPPAKRFLSEDERFLLNSALPTPHMSLSGRDASGIVVSMEVGGITYRGMLFAQTNSSHRSRLS